nr:MAG TPA: hypothetical protein [Caudoviricetes sp.]
MRKNLENVLYQRFADFGILILTGNRVVVKSGTRVRIPPTAPDPEIVCSQRFPGFFCPNIFQIFSIKSQKCWGVIVLCKFAS